MKSNKYFVFLLFIIITATIYIGSIGVISIFYYNPSETEVSINGAFSFFTISSLIMLIVHFIIYLKNKEQLGFVFLITLTLKVAASFFM